MAIGAGELQDYWSEELNGNIQKIEDHGLSTDDFEFVFENYESEELSPERDAGNS